MNKIPKVSLEYFFLFILVVVTILVRYFREPAGDILLIILISSICYIIYDFLKTKNRNLAILSTLFICLNFIIFPVAYLILLKYNKSSFEFDNQISINEKDNSLTEISELYNFKQISRERTLINQIFLDSNSIQDNSFSLINKGSMIFTKNYILSKGCIRDPFDRQLKYKATLNVYDKSGKFIGYISTLKEYCNEVLASASLFDYLNSRLLLVSKEMNLYEARKKNSN